MNLKTLIFCLVLPFYLFSQDTLFIKLGGYNEYDAALGGSSPNTNWRDFPDFHALTWTCGGVKCVDRSLIRFNLNLIPAGSDILDARLSLFASPNPQNGNGIAMFGDDNSALLQRVTSYWDKNNVTFATQPQTTAQNQVVLNKSTSSTQNYLNINITQLVKEMFADPSNSYGLMLRLKTEEYYNAMIFASGNHQNSALWPEIKIIYNSPVGIDKFKNDNDLPVNFHLINNSTMGVRIEKSHEVNIKIFDTKGVNVFAITKYFQQGIHSFEIPYLKPGIYFIRSENSKVFKFIAY
jgi:hypothetical protein